MSNKKKRKPMELSSEDKNEAVVEVMPEIDRRPIKKKAVKPNPVEEKPVVPLRVFLAVCGSKWDQAAGFKYYAEKNKLGPYTVEQWRVEFKNFWDKPTK